MAVRSLLNGRYAEATLNGTLIALLYEWDVKVTGQTADLTAHGDTWHYKAPLASSWKFSAKNWVVPASVSHLIHTLFAAATLPAYVTVTGYSGNHTTGTPIFAGTGLPVGADLSAPMELARQGFEIEGHGAPSTGVS